MQVADWEAAVRFLAYVLGLGVQPSARSWDAAIAAVSFFVHEVSQRVQWCHGGWVALVFVVQDCWLWAGFCVRLGKCGVEELR